MEGTLSVIPLTASLIAVVIALPPPPAKLTRHEAKVRTFAALLRETETAPDSADATHANITVRSCRRISSSTWACKGSLYPVVFSGIGGDTCAYVATVTPSRVRLNGVGC